MNSNKTHDQKKFSMALFFLLTFYFLVMKSATAGTIININSKTNTPSNPVTEFLTAGTYKIVPIGQSDGGNFTAYNPWRTLWGSPLVTGCDASGENCNRGWRWSFFISSPSFGEIFFSHTGTYQTPGQALAVAPSNLGFDLTQDNDTNFYIRDTIYSDNHGGISFKLSLQSAQPSQVPSPDTLALLSLGFISAVISGVINRKISL